MSRSKVDFEQHLITCILCKKEVANHMTLDHSKTLDVYVRNKLHIKVHCLNGMFLYVHLSSVCSKMIVFMQHVCSLVGGSKIGPSGLRPLSRYCHTRPYLEFSS